MIVVMPDKMNGENHSLVRLFLKSGFMKELDLTKGSVLKNDIKHDIDNTSQSDKIKRSFRIAQSSKNPTYNVISHDKRNAYLLR